MRVLGVNESAGYDMRHGVTARQVGGRAGRARSMNVNLRDGVCNSDKGRALTSSMVSIM